MRRELQTRSKEQHQTVVNLECNPKTSQAEINEPNATRIKHQDGELRMAEALGMSSPPRAVPKAPLGNHMSKGNSFDSSTPDK